MGVFLLILGGFTYMIVNAKVVEDEVKEEVEYENKAKENINREGSYEIVELDKESRAELESTLNAPEKEAIYDKENSIAVLLVGVDSREGTFTGRSDALMVMTINKKTKDTKVLSIPRDSYVWIEGKGINDKINHAHAFGKIPMVRDTVENLLGIGIDYYATVNFNSFIEVVDLLGGVEVEVPFDFTEKDRYDNWLSFSKGVMNLDGESALAYSRMRNQDPKGDIGRGERQQQVVKALLNKGNSFSNITKVKDIFNIVEDNVETDVGLGDIMTLFKYVGSLSEVDLLGIEGNGVSIGGIYYYELDKGSLREVKEELRNHVN